MSSSAREPEIANSQQLFAIFAMYGFLDGLNVTSSTLRLVFDIRNNNNNILSAKAMRRWMMTEEGIAVVALEAFLIISLSLIANISANIKNKNELQRRISLIYASLRDISKSLKNAYKANRTTILAFNFFASQDLRFLIIPLGLSLGVLSAINRILSRQLDTARAAIEKSNQDLFRKIEDHHADGCDIHLLATRLPTDLSEYINQYIIVETDEGWQLYYIASSKDKLVAKRINITINRELMVWNELINTSRKHLSSIEMRRIITLPAENNYDLYQNYRDNILKPSNLLSIQGFVSKVYAGIIDGLYLYMGAVILTPFTPPIFIMVLSFSLIFSFTCILTRVYEEYCAQKKLEITRQKIQLKIFSRELLTLFDDLDTSLFEQCTAETVILRNAWSSKLAEFNQVKLALRANLNSSISDAVLKGLTNGLAIYGVLAAFIFSLSTVAMIGAFSLPAPLVVAFVVVGMVFLFGFVVHELISYVGKSAVAKQLNAGQDNSLENWSQTILTCQRINNNIQDGVKSIIQELVTHDKPKSSVISSGSEVFRSGFSAIGKGPKAIEFTCTALQTESIDGRNYDSSFMIGLMAILTPIYIFVLGYSAYNDKFCKKKSSSQTPSNDTNTAPLYGNATSLSPRGESRASFFSNPGLHQESADSPPRRAHSTSPPVGLPMD